MQGVICNIKQKAWKFDKVAWLPAGSKQRICWLLPYFPPEWNFNRLTSRTRPPCLRRPCFPDHLSGWLPWTLIALNHHESSIKMCPRERGRPRQGAAGSAVGICRQVWLWDCNIVSLHRVFSVLHKEKERSRVKRFGGRKVWVRAPG